MLYRLKKQAVQIVFLVLWCAGALAPSIYAQPVSSDELINSAQQYNGQTVAYIGEVIGDIMRRGSHAWLNVSDGSKAIGVWADVSLIKEVNLAGSYHARGDLIEVAGVFNRACPEHGGDLDIHASQINKIVPGQENFEVPDAGKRNIVIILLGVLCLTWILTQFKKR